MDCCIMHGLMQESILLRFHEQRVNCNFGLFFGLLYITLIFVNGWHWDRLGWSG